eukprot:CAMPEP_0117857250 /NCGR_PEP_ID=MMETSP0950-20121206/1767_1 /TAXON_ID=44440 /ORGANISM="Chattonella subsalsa, Strain CCMP2191" /LENGTH=103 /DNA_ID=CAMNT_0005706579 /DNA_START=323 /DNA_END=634 /DNA_ORIENTATION=+
MMVVQNVLRVGLNFVSHMVVGVVANILIVVKVQEINFSVQLMEEENGVKFKTVKKLQLEVQTDVLHTVVVEDVREKGVQKVPNLRLTFVSDMVGVADVESMDA